MSIKERDQPIKRPRELGRIGTAGSFITAFGLLWIMSYFVSVSWLTSLLLDSISYFWRFTGAFGWVILLSGGIIFTVGAGLMLADWKRRAPEQDLAEVKAREKVKSATAYDATQPQLAHHIEA